MAMICRACHDQNKRKSDGVGVSVKKKKDCKKNILQEYNNRKLRNFRNGSCK
jgi:hypothetical protein